MKSLVLTIIGKDQPGLVDRVAAVIADHGGSWEESRMAHLAGQFAGILRASVPADRVATVEKELRSLESGGLRVTIEHGQEKSTSEERPLVHLELIGTDRPGIIRSISHALAERGVNVEELKTECDSAPWSGDTLFKATAELRVPPGFDLDALRGDLEDIAQDLMVDIKLAREI